MEQLLAAICKNARHVISVHPIDIEGNNNTCSFNDARSAAFYALGLAIKEKEPVYLLVPGAFVTSTFTAVTEAWFQKANVIVIAFFERVSDVKTAWMDRCVLDTLTVGENEQELFAEFIQRNTGVNGPVLLNVVCQRSDVEKTDYKDAMKYLESGPIIAFNGEKLSHGINVDYRHKYGLLSKYIGMSSVKDCGVLLCTADAVLVDVNIFRTRYANANMKIVIIDNDGSITLNGIDDWITSNGWRCRVSDSFEDINWLLAQEKQSVLVVKEA